MDHHNSNTRHKRKNSKLPLSNFSSTKSSSPNTFQLLRGDCKQTLLDLTPSLRLPATPARETSEFYDQINNLDPIKFSPPDSAGSTVGKMRPDRHPSYSTFAMQNPYCDERYTQIEEFYDAATKRQHTMQHSENKEQNTPRMSQSQSEDFVAAQLPREDTFGRTKIHENKPHEDSYSPFKVARNAQAFWDHGPEHDKKYTHESPGVSLLQSGGLQKPQFAGEDASRYAKKYGHKSPGISHSKSESNIDFCATARDDYSIRVGKKFAVGGTQNRSSDDSTATASSAHSRGRTVNRTPSPVKHLDDIREDCTPPPKRSRSPMKQLFGPHGWLGKSMSMKELPGEENRKGGIKQLGDRLKQRIEHITEDVSKFVPTNVYHHRSPSKSPSKSKFYVSLSPPQQAKLYSEMELMICATANQYLTIQQKEGRMSPESITKVTQFWASKNRPQVIEFMFDQATQRDLVLYNLKAFRFYGCHAENAVSMNSMMLSWKTLAREMSVRTFCTPDSVVKKQMHDTYKILEMLGAPLVTFLAFQEIQVKALKIMAEEQKKRDESHHVKFGVETRWNPPTKTVEELEELENPFA